MIDITHEQQVAEIIRDGVKLNSLIDQYLLLSVVHHGTINEASKHTGVGVRTYGMRGIRPRSENIAAQIRLIDARREVERIEKRMSGAVEVQTDDEVAEIRLRDVSRFIEQCPEEFLLLIQSDLDARKGVTDAVTA